MQPRRIVKQLASALAALGLSGATLAQGSPGGSHSQPTIKAVAEVVQKSAAGGRETTRLVNADEVVPGDEVIWTLEIRNQGLAPLPAPTVDYPIPAHMQYVANSAVGAGAEVSYSVDDGHTFGRPDALKIVDSKGERPAIAADYTTIRWQLKHALKGNSVAMAHFRAICK
jgi:uncharacterized repeat protein (TIGR01451 family)